MRVVESLVWIGVVASSTLGVLIVFGGMASANSAPQEAVVVALGMSFAVIPYCIARAVSEIAKLNAPEATARSQPLITPAPEMKSMLRKPVGIKINDLTKPE